MAAVDEGTPIAPTTLETEAEPGDRSAAIDDSRLLERYHQEGDVAARDELIRRRLPLARRLAHRYRGSHEPTEDLIQVASLALVKAVDRYDVDRGTSFTTFAVPTMLGELKRHFRDHGWGLRVPRPVQELALRARDAGGRLHAGLGRSPTFDELARALEAPVEDVIEALEAAQAMSPRSLDAPVEDAEEERTPSAELIGAVDERYELTEDLASARRGLRALDDRERMAVWMRFFEDRTQAEIAAELGVSQMQVSRLLRRAIDRIRTILDREAEAAAA